MKNLLKWAGIALVGVVGLLVLVVAAVYALSAYRFNRTFDVQAI